MHGATMKFFGVLSNNTQISSLMKIQPVVTEFFHEDGRTDMTKLIVSFRSFAKKPKTDQWKTKLTENMEPIIQKDEKFQVFSLQ